MLGELVDNVNWVPASFRIKMESADMTKQDVTNILSGLGDPGKKTALIAVMGGRFSEGVDYSGGVLSAAITLGLPLPPPHQDKLQLSIISQVGSEGRGGGATLLRNQQ